MAETKNNDERFPEVKPTKPGNDTAYIAPIIGKLGYDTRRPWLFGLGTSPNNGVDFHVFLSFDGLNFDDNDIDKIWNGGTADKVKKEVDSATAEIPAAVSAANSAVSAAESAVAASKVNSDAIVAQSEAISEAKAAMDSATAEIQQTAANAASDAAKIRADVAQVQSEVDTAKAANSASVEALKSDVSAAKQDLSDVHDSLDKAQSAIEQNQKLINDNVAKITSDVSATKQDLATVHDSLAKAQAAAEQNQKAIDDSIAKINNSVDATNQDLAGVRKDLTKAQSDITANQKSINDNVAQIDADITQDRKDIASAQQANANTAKQLDTYSKQATEQGKTIKSIQDKQDSFTATLADVQGNVTQVSDKVDGLSANLKDAQDNVASVKAQADQLSATLTDHAKSIATLTASAKEISSTLEDADGQLSKVEQTAQTNSSTLSDLQGDLSQVKQDATTLTATLKDAQGNISTLQQKADSVSAQLASAQGDIATLQTGIDGVKATLASHDKTIHTLQLDSKSLKDSMADAQGDISTLQKTATSLNSEIKDHAGRLSKVEQSAATQATTLSDLQGNLTQVKQQADGLVTTLKDAQGSITQIQQKADGTLEQLKSAQGDIASLQTDVTGIKATLTSHEGDIHTLQADSKTLKDDMTDAQGNISSLQKSSTKLDSEFSSQDGRLSKVEQTAKEHTSTISDLGDKLNNLKVGTSNLLHNSDTFAGWVKNATASISKDKYLNGSILVMSPSKIGADGVNTDLDGPYDDQIVTWTVYAKADNAGDKLHTELWGGGGVTDQPLTTDWKLYRFSGHRDSRQHSFFLWGTIGNKGNIYVALPYAVVGNTIGSWLPNPADLATLTQVKQTADGIETTLKNAQGDINQIRQQANGTSEQLSNVQGNVTNIQKDVDGLKQTTADNAGNIHTLQSDSKMLKDDMQDAQGDISTLKKTSTDVTTELKDHAGRISKTEQTAATLTNEFADQQGHLNRVEQKATGTEQTVANQQGQINTIKTDTAGIHETLTGQGNQIANINVTLGGLNTKYEGVSGDLSNLSNKAMQNRGTVNSPDFNSLTQAGYYTVTLPINGKNYPTGSWGTLEVSGDMSDANGRLNQKYVSDNNGTAYTRQYNASAKLWTAWVKEANQYDVDTLNGKITTNSTQITQNQQAIALKADQSTVSNLSGEVSQNSAQLKVQSDQISSKVSSTDFKVLNDKVDGMKIGGRNLVAGTGQDTVIDDTANTGTQGWCFRVFNLTQQPKVGDQITVSAEGTLTGRGDLSTYEVILYNSTTTTNRSNSMRLTSGKRSSATLEVTNLNGTGDTVLLIYAGNISDTEGKKNVIHHLKVEFGNVATDWIPAPEDTIIAIQKNSTAIDQINQKISLKADQTEVDKVKNTASQNSSRLNVMANEISSKVTSTDVNNIVDSKGYATTSTVQSLITQKAGTINESITKLDQSVKTGAENNVQLVRKSDFEDGDKGGWSVTGVVSATNPAPPAELGQSGMKVLQTNTRDSYEEGIWYSVKPGEKFDVDFWCCPSPAFHTTFGLTFVDKNKGNFNWIGINSDQSGQWKHYTGTITAPANASFAKPWYQMEKPASNTTNSSWIAKPSIRRQNATTVAAIQHIAASIDGLQSTVANKADKSQITQLSNLVQSKVSSADFNSRITQLSNDINLRVTKGNVLSQINLEAGRTLIQSNKIYLDADSVVFSNRAFIPSAAIVNLDASKLTFYGSGGTYATMGSGVKQYDQDNLKNTINLQYNGGVEVHASNELGSILTMHDDTIRLAVKSQVYGSGSGQPINQQYSGVWFGNNYTLMNTVDKEGKTTGWAIGSNKGGVNNDYRAYLYDNSTSVQPNYGVGIGTTRFDVYAGNSQLFLGPDKGELRGSEHATLHGGTQTYVEGGNEQIYIHDGEVNIGNPNNFGSNTSVHLTVAGWADFKGWVNAMGITQTSLLSTKTRIEPLDTAYALQKINEADVETYQFKTDVADGQTKRHTSVVIDDVHDVAQYNTPEEFVSENRKGRDDGDIIGFLMGAVQELAKQLDKVKEKVNNE